MYIYEGFTSHLYLRICISGQQEVMGDRVPVQEEPVPEPEAVASPSEAQSGDVQPAIRPSIDQMIQQLQRAQDQRLVAEGRIPLLSPPSVPMGSPNARSAPSRSNSGIL